MGCAWAIFEVFFIVFSHLWHKHHNTRSFAMATAAGRARCREIEAEQAFCGHLGAADGDGLAKLPGRCVAGP